MPTPQLLVLDADLLFSQRFCELAKRRWPTTPYRAAAHDRQVATGGGFTIRAAEVLGHAQASGHTVLVISSEALVFAADDDARDQVIRELAAISRDASVQLIVVAFQSVLSVVNDESGLRVTDVPTAGYSDALACLKDALDSRNATIIAAPPYVTHCESPVQVNPANVLWQGQSNPRVIDRFPELLPGNVVLADRIIEDVLTRIEQTAISTDVPSSDAQESRAINDAHLSMLPVQLNCSLKVLYRKHPQECVGGSTVAQLRQTLGSRLAATLPPEVVERIDLVVPVPETGRWYAAGVADALGKPCVEGVYKREEGRSFDIQNHARRREFIKQKLGVNAASLAGKSIAIVDEAIFTGATMRQVAMLLRDTAVESVFLLIASPECKNRCGVNMQPDRAMLSEYVRDEDLAAYFDVNAVFFQDEHEYELVMSSAGYHCTRCFRATNAW